MPSVELSSPKLGMNYKKQKEAKEEGQMTSESSEPRKNYNFQEMDFHWLLLLALLLQQYYGRRIINLI